MIVRGQVPASPDVQLLGGEAVVLQGAAAVDAYRLIHRGVAATQALDGIVPSPRLLSLLAALKQAADAAQQSVSAGGHADVRKEAEPARLISQVGIADAAGVLGLSERHVRRMAEELGGRKVGRSWFFDRAAVLAYRLEKESA